MNVRVDPHSLLPPSQQLVAAVLDAIAAGELPPGARLPSVRGLASEALVNPNTVTKAYRAYAKKVSLDGGGYTMDHSAIVYLMDKDGRFVAPFNLKRSADQAAADLKRRL